MTWNYRVQMNVHESPDGSKEHSATIHEVYYSTEKGVGSTDEIAPMGTGDNATDALESLKSELLLMLESVQFVLDGKTPVYDYENKETHDPGHKSLILKARYGGVDPDDAYRDEQDEE